MTPKLPQLLSMLGAATLMVGVAACASEGEGGGGTCTGAKCDDLDKPDSEIPDSPCDGVIVDKSGRDHDKVAGRLHDPIAEFVFKAGSDCPKSFADIMDKMRQTDTENCDPADPRAGITTRAVSETAQLAASATNYRLVTSRTCGNRQAHEVLFSLFGIRAGATSMPKNVEMIAFDASAGVFNYYETDGRTINFFGNSKDFVGKGTGSGDDRRCAGCHTGGGLIMKELESPWVHWEGDTVTPGADELIAAHEDLGSKSDGIELESTVSSANSTWNASRIEFLKSLGDTKKILEPLFCDTEINLRSGGFGDLSSVPADFLLPSQVSDFPFISIDPAIYAAERKENGQTVQGTGKEDTFFPFTFAKKALSDDDYIRQLVSAGILDDELVKDVMMVDFTRPVFSSDRCDLLDFVPGIPAAELSPATIKAGLLAELGSPSAGSPADELKKNLESEIDQAGHVAQYTAMCTARAANDQAAFVDDFLAVASLNRDKARELQVMEFPQTMASDNQSVDADTRFDPETCELTTAFVGTNGKGLGRILVDDDRATPAPLLK